MRQLALTTLLLGLTLIGGRAQDAPQVRFLAPPAGAIVHDSLLIQVEGQGFQDLKTFGFADFFYSRDGQTFLPIGSDRNTFDGLSLLWDTSGVEDGSYVLQVEVTDLFNLQGQSSQPVFVNNHGNQSFTNRVLQNLAPAFEALAQALDFPADLSLSQAVEVARQNLEQAALTFEATLADLEAIQAGAPAVIAEADPFLRQTELFQRLNAAIAATQDRFEALDLAGTQQALEELSAATRALSALRPNGVDEAIERASAQLEQLFAASQGGTGQTVEEAFNGFLELARQAVGQVRAVAQALAGADRDCPLTFSDGQGRVAVHTRQGTPVVVQLGTDRAAGEVTLYDSQGQPLRTVDLEAGRFGWDGRDGAGRMVAPGATFFVLSFVVEGAERVKTGRLVVLP